MKYIFNGSEKIKRFRIIFLILSCIYSNLTGSEPIGKLSLSLNDVSLEEFFQSIEKQSDYRFLYRHETIQGIYISIDIKNAGIEEILDKTLTPSHIEYTVLSNELIVIKPLDKAEKKTVIHVEGIVLSAIDKNPLPGVIITEKGESRIQVTNEYGKFSFGVSDASSVLIFEMLGYIGQEIQVGNQSNITILLQEDITELNQVVVVGYGQMKRVDITGAVASIDEETLKKTQSTNIDQAMQGRVAGVQVTQNSGQPGGATSVRIRGASSITGSNEPLYIIDGIQFQGDGIIVAGFDWAGGTNGQNRVNPLSTINPNDISNIEVLKDASAAAIYGSQAANGVVIINTRRGTNGKSSVVYNTYITLQKLQRKIPMMNLPEYAVYHNQVSEELGDPLNERYLDPGLLGKGTNWQDEIFNTAWINNHHLAVSGGNENTNYALAIGYYNQEGIIIGSGFNRYTGRINIENQVRKWINVGANLAYSKTGETITLNDGGDGVIMNALTMPPDIPVRNFNGEYAGPEVSYSVSRYNPVALALIRNNSLSRERIMGNIHTGIDITKNLNFKSEFSLDNNSFINIAFHPTYKFGVLENRISKMRERTESNTFWNLTNILTYQDKISDDHWYSIMLAQEAQKTTVQGVEITKENFATNDLPVLSQGDNPTLSTNGWKDAAARASYFGRLFYNFHERFLLTLTLRSDGSSKFGPAHKWGYFPSGSFAWRLSNERFLSNSPYIHDMKLRIGYGMVGNSAIGNYLYGSSMVSNNSPFGTFYRMEKISNPNLKWESTAMYNIGLDISLFKGRISLVTEVFKKVTEDMLLQLPIPNYLGGPNNWQDISAPYVNLGKMENKGLELSLTSYNIIRRKFSWQSDLIFTLNRNKIVELEKNNSVIFDGLYWYSEFQTATMTRAGYPIGVYYGYQTEGIFSNEQEILNHAVQVSNPGTITAENPNGVNLVDRTTGVWIGDIKFKDLNEDGVVNEKDQTIIGNPNPDFTIGINNSLNLGSLEFSLYLQGSYGAEILNYSKAKIEDMTILYCNQSANVNNRAQYEVIDPTADPDDPSNIILINPETNIPRFATNDVNRNNRMSDRFIENGSYLRIQNISIGYTLPSDITQQIRIQRFKIYINLQNLYTFTKYTGYDPEIGAFNQNARMQNIDMGRYPTPRMITIGITAEF